MPPAHCRDKFLSSFDLTQYGTFVPRYPRGMSKVHELLELAQECYARARDAVDPDSKRALVQQGDAYLRQADELQRGRNVVQAAFPKPDR
jgi:hypothetical protein